VLWGRIPRGNGGRVAAVLLVDNAAQPMQAAPVAALKGIAVSGNASKLHVIFTHFDQVKGDNLPGFSDREQHVLASVENVLKSIGDELGPAAERVLRRRIDQARFFVGGIQDPLDAKKKAGSCSIQQLDAALNLLADPELAADAGPSRPVFNRMNLSLAVMEAAKTFHTRWRGILGLDYNRDAPTCIVADAIPAWGWRYDSAHTLYQQQRDASPRPAAHRPRHRRSSGGSRRRRRSARRGSPRRPSR
jgi:hypothetical protein